MALFFHKDNALSLGGQDVYWVLENLKGRAMIDWDKAQGKYVLTLFMKTRFGTDLLAEISEFIGQLNEGVA